MLELLRESSVRATLIALAVGLLMLVFRIKAAHLKYAAWTAVASGMLLLPLLILWGPRASIQVLSAKTAPEPIMLLDASPSVVVAQAPAYAGPATEGPASLPLWQPWMLGIYVVGLLIMFVRLGTGAWRVHRLKREAVFENGVFIHSSCTTPITAGWLHARIIVPPEWTSWTEQQRNLILAHEQEHLRRHHSFFQWVALLNRGVFWFHPLAWWLERRIAELAEQSCDMAVLEQGHDPHDYSACLISMGRMLEQRGTRIQIVAMTMPGSRLTDRIQRILRYSPAPEITRWRFVTTVIACAAVAGVLASGRLVQAQPKLSFDVSVVKPAAPDAVGTRAQLLGGNELKMTNITLKEIIAGAYQRVFGQELEIVGGPDWIGSKRFDVAAKTLQERPTAAQLKEMEQTLLAERFGLRVHWDSKEADIFALVLSRKDGRLGPKITRLPDEKCQPDPDEPETPGGPEIPGPCEINFHSQGMVLQGATMEHLANALGLRPLGLGRQVVDRTGVAGRFDMKLDFAITRPDGAGGRVADLVPETGPSIFAALEEQLGVKLESARGKVEFLVVDAAQMPTEN